MLAMKSSSVARGISTVSHYLDDGFRCIELLHHTRMFATSLFNEALKRILRQRELQRSSGNHKALDSGMIARFLTQYFMHLLSS